MIRFRSFVVLSCVAAAPFAAAQIFNEGSDVGNLPGSAQILTTTSTTLTINGSIDRLLDQDMFRITIGNAANFSVIVEEVGGLDDSQIFLFQMNGQGIAFNDDIDGDNLMSHLPVGNSLYASLPAGNYLLAISPFDIDARINSSANTSQSNYVFPFNTGTSTLISGPITSSPIVAWDSDPSFNVSALGNYRIQITGLQAVPEPGTLAVLGLGALAAVRRRKR